MFDRSAGRRRADTEAPGIPSPANDASTNPTPANDASTNPTPADDGASDSSIAPQGNPGTGSYASNLGDFSINVADVMARYAPPTL